ncbi:MAG: DUF3105 domain-containing protein [Chloroflexota bacterium]|nr:DUF3105 domain-containing protein [Chloroflexota bacterium]
MARHNKDKRQQAERKLHQRERRRARHDARGRRRRILYLSLSGIVAILLVGSFVVAELPIGTGGLPEQTPGTNQSVYVKNIGEKQNIMSSAEHLDGQLLQYNTTPPTSGDHWSAPSQCGFYTTQVNDEAIVHNLEHGHVILSYHLPDEADVDKLRQIHEGLAGSSNWLITRPYPALSEGEVALAAWGVLDKFDVIDEERIELFFETYKGNLFSTETRSLGQGIPCTNVTDTMAK